MALSICHLEQGLPTLGARLVFSPLALHSLFKSPSHHQALLKLSWGAPGASLGNPDLEIHQKILFKCQNTSILYSM